MDRHINYRLLIFPRIIFALFLFILILGTPLILISQSESFYMHRLAKSNCAEMISEKDCVDLSLNALNYLKGKEELDYRYSQREQSHFEDVKKIFDFAKALLVVLFIFTIIYFAMIYFFLRDEIFKTIYLAGWITVGFLLLLLIMITISFQTTFFAFHALFFPQGNWSFPFDYTIITVFPEEFFIYAAFTSFLISLGFGVLALGISRLFGNVSISRK